MVRTGTGDGRRGTALRILQDSGFRIQDSFVLCLCAVIGHALELAKFDTALRTDRTHYGTTDPI